MAHATTICLSEFADAFRADKGWVQSTACGEIVFDFPLKRFPGVVVRVYTSISIGATVTRSIGSDAIRVCAVDTVSAQGVVKAARVHRVAGWHHNLVSRVTSVWHDAIANMERKEKFGYWKRPVLALSEKVG